MKDNQISVFSSIKLGLRDNNGRDGKGYPRGTNGNPVYFVIPNFLTLTILEKLLAISLEKELKNKKDELFSDKIKDAINVFKSKNQ